MDKLARRHIKLTTHLHRFFMTLPLVDTHCHLHDERLWSSDSPSSRRAFEDVVHRARNANITHVVSCATHERDWRVLELLMEQQKDDKAVAIVPSFGIHPWWAHDLWSTTLDSLDPLRNVLTRYPASSVGEIGLCKSVRGRQVPLDVQMTAFRVQLELAAELKRTSVLHCVGYHGKLLEVLQDVAKGGKLPPILVLHSYSGPPDMIRSFLRLRDTRVFFSLNAKQLTDPRMKKAAACCKEMPLESLLLETDAPDQAPSAEQAEKVFNREALDAKGLPLLLQQSSTDVNEPVMVKLALQSAAEIRGVGLNDLAAAVYQNCKTAFGIDDSILN
ncbi:TatD related DNase [Phytophthora infestans]|uniref:TatD related DNase n=1 Tax=Phytophthora infestans TaxID=4787 RepID=A0A8S9TPR1_PHYIN|nr:TatD related DNase [Phytophthora infestans]